MAPIKVGDTIPDGSLFYMDDNNQKQEVSVHSLAAGKRVILVAVPGAFTSVCSQKHMPGFISKGEEFKSKGIDEIICVSVNDQFVMKEWSKTFLDNQHVKFLADGTGAYTRALDLELDLSPLGLGVRSQRYALLIDDLKVKIANIETGGAFEVSSADEILKAL